MPRPVEPEQLPAPAVEPRSLARSAARDESFADAAARVRLDVDVGHLGREMRRYNLADAGADDLAVRAARDRVAQFAGPAAAVGPEEIAKLRAFQLRSFLRELHRWAATGAESDELREVSGNFLGTCRQNRWCTDAPRALLVGDAALRVLFKKRFAEVTGIALPERSSGSPLALDVDEERALLAFLIAHPLPGAAGASLGMGSPGWAAARRTFEDQYRLKKIDDLAALDPAYPAHFARGVVLYRLGKFPLAVEAFRAHLEAAPDGPWTLRAQNHLRAALGRARDEDL